MQLATEKMHSVADHIFSAMDDANSNVNDMYNALLHMRSVDDLFVSSIRLMSSTVQYTRRGFDSMRSAAEYITYIPGRINSITKKVSSATEALYSPADSM